MELKPEPATEVNNKTRFQIKVAYIIYPEDNHKEKRIDAINGVNEFLKNGSIGATTISALPQPSGPGSSSNDIDQIKSSIIDIQEQIINRQKSFQKQVMQLHYQ